MARSKVTFTFDRKGFEAGVAKAVNGTVQKLAADLTRMLAGMSTEFQGRPVDEIKPVLQSRWKSATGGGSITDPELTAYAEQIAAGHPITVKADKLA